MKKNNCYVITGAPGVGKTTLIEELKKYYGVVSEPAREVIAHQRKTHGDKLWDRNRQGFVDELLNSSVQKFQNANSDHLVFFDRGIPDCHAYANYGGLNLERFEQASHQFRYNKTVFLLEPWKDIYVMDEERTMDFGEVVSFHKDIQMAYRSYEIRIIPRGTVLDRLSYLIEALG